MLLNKIGKEHTSALEVKEHQLGRDKVAVHHDMVDLIDPGTARCISELSVKDYILPLLSQSRRGVDLGAGISALRNK
jgi:hypothetical protein